MSADTESTYTAFADEEKIFHGSWAEVVEKVKAQSKKHSNATYLIFDDISGEQMDIDVRPAPPVEDIPKKSGPGRPRLGVISKEITLLPQHWDWLASQPGGASVTLRKLVEDAKKKNQSRDQSRKIQESTHRFMTVMAGNLPQFEEALRALYAKDKIKFEKIVKAWPEDIREHTLMMAHSLWE